MKTLIADAVAEFASDFLPGVEDALVDSITKLCEEAARRERNECIHIVRMHTRQPGGARGMQITDADIVEQRGRGIMNAIRARGGR